MAKVGYARVSTGHQTLDGQHDALNIAGADRIFAAPGHEYTRNLLAAIPLPDPDPAWLERP